MTTATTTPVKPIQKNIQTIYGLGFGQYAAYDISETDLIRLQIDFAKDLVPVIETIEAPLGGTYEPISDFIQDTITVVTGTFRDVPVTVWASDNGLLHEGTCLGWRIKFEDRPKAVTLVGPLVVSGSNEKDQTITSPLTDENIRTLIREGVITPVALKL